MQSAPPHLSSAKSTARGWFSLASAKIYFICTSYAIHLVLPRIFDTPREYGLFSSAFALMVLLNGAIGGANMQITSRAVSAAGDASEKILRRALVTQKIISLSCAVAVYVCAGWIGALFDDPDLPLLLRCGSGGVFAVALYATFVGVSNGRQNFAQQARMDLVFSSLRAGGVILGAFLGGSAMFAVLGFSGATLLLLLGMLFYFGPGEEGATLDAKTYLNGFGQIALYLTLFNALQQLDLYVLKHALAADHEHANHVVGLYRAAQIFAFIPLQAVMATSQVAFPKIARAISEKNDAQVGETLRVALLVTWWTVLALAAPLSATAHGFVALAFPSAYSEASSALQVLAIAMAALGMFAVGANALNSAGRSLASVSAALFGCAGLGISCSLFLTFAGSTASYLRLTSLGSIIGAVCALSVVAFTVHREFRGLPKPAALLRALLAALISYAVAFILPHDRALPALFAFIAGVVTFGATLYVLGDLRPARLRETLAAVRT